MGPEDFVTNTEPNARLQDIQIGLNRDVDEREFEAMIGRAQLSGDGKRALRELVSLNNVQATIFNSYWRLEVLEEADCFEKMLQLDIRDIRRLLHPDASFVQGRHSIEEA